VTTIKRKKGNGASQPGTTPGGIFIGGPIICFPDASQLAAVPRCEYKDIKGLEMLAFCCPIRGTRAASLIFFIHVSGPIRDHDRKETAHHTQHTETTPGGSISRWDPLFIFPRSSQCGTFGPKWLIMLEPLHVSDACAG
jgi:hypothetical protein